MDLNFMTGVLTHNLQINTKNELLRMYRFKEKKMGKELDFYNTLEKLYNDRVRPLIEKIIDEDNNINIEKTSLKNSCTHYGAHVNVDIFCDFLIKKGFKVEEIDNHSGSYIYINISWDKLY